MTTKSEKAPGATLREQANDSKRTQRRPLPPPNPRQRWLVYGVGLTFAMWLLFLLTMALMRQ